MTYSEQLRHPLWQRKRLEVLDKAEWSCQACRSLSTYLDTKTICLLGQSLADPVFAQDLIKALSDADKRLEEQIRKEMGEAS